MDRKSQPPEMLQVLAKILATPGGQHLAKRLYDAQQAAVGIGQGIASAPQRIGDAAQMVFEGGGDPNAIGSAALEAGLMGAGVSGRTLAPANPRPPAGSNYSKAIGPELPADAANYTDKHALAGREAFRKLLADPSKDLNRTTLKQEYLKNVARSGAKNVGPQGQQLDDMVAETMGLLNPRTNLSDPRSMERQVIIATNNKRNGVPWTLGVPGAVGAGAAMEGEQDPQTAQVADIIRRIREGR